MVTSRIVLILQNQICYGLYNKFLETCILSSMEIKLSLERQEKQHTYTIYIVHDEIHSMLVKT